MEVRYLDEPSGLEPGDRLVVPGCEDTIVDLRYLKARGFAAAPRACRARRHVLRWSGGGRVGGRGGVAGTMRDHAYDRLADALEASVGMDVFRRLLRR